MPGLTGHLLYRPTGTKMGACVPGGMKNQLRGTKRPSGVPGCRSRSQVEIRPFPFAGPSGAVCEIRKPEKFHNTPRTNLTDPWPFQNSCRPWGR